MVEEINRNYTIGNAAAFVVVECHNKPTIQNRRHFFLFPSVILHQRFRKVFSAFHLHFHRYAFLESWSTLVINDTGIFLLIYLCRSRIDFNISAKIQVIKAFCGIGSGCVNMKFTLKYNIGTEIAPLARPIVARRSKLIFIILNTWTFS